jgi:hypothetical protein
VKNIVVTTGYSSVVTDHRTLYSCDWFDLKGVEYDSELLDQLRYLDECPSQGVQPVMEHLLISLRNNLEVGETYRVSLAVEADRCGSDERVFTYTDELKAKLCSEAGDYDEDQ